MAITMQRVTLAQAEAQFPGAVDEDTRDMDRVNQKEPDYHWLLTYRGRLYSRTYEIAWCGWSVWLDGVWRDLDDADEELYEKLEHSRAPVVFLPPAE